MTGERAPDARDRGSNAWRRFMYERAVRNVEHWAGRVRYAATEGEKTTYARQEMAATIAALQYSDHDLTVVAFPVPEDYGSRDFDTQLWPEHAQAIDETMPCILCGTAIKGRMNSQPEGAGMYCERCSTL